ncbi:MAG: UDP-glucose 4-epimerase GalE [Desulfobacterales bacterium]
MKQTILVVGGAGYIGSHMVKALLHTGYGVVCLDNLSTGHRDMVVGGNFINGHLGDGSLLDEIFTDHAIAGVMHFAAFSQVGQSVTDPLTYYRNNIAETIQLIAAMVRHGIMRFIFSSSAAVYGEPVDVPILEDHPQHPTSPYGTTKATVEQLLRDCDTAHGIKSVSLRYFNASGADASGTIGEKHQPETHLIPLVLKVAAGQRDHIDIFGTQYPTPDGTCIRDYIHVSDLTRAHLLAMESLFEGKESKIYNLGNSKGYSVREVIQLARQITGHAIPTIEADIRPGDPAVLIAGSDKIRRELGWKPVYEDLTAILRTAWDWHRKERTL